MEEGPRRIPPEKDEKERIKAQTSLSAEGN